MPELSAAFIETLDPRWRLDRKIGEGGTARVFLAEDRRHARPVAVKVVRPELASDDAARRFAREVALTARFRHPNILPLIDSGTAADCLYFVAPYVEGGSLRARLDREGALPVSSIVRIVNDVAEALDYAHAQGVVHRDIKPENILLESDRAVVADFGIAHAIGVAAADRLTASGIALGTPAYMSPEQCDGPHVDGRADLYSLGCVLYEMLSGHAPFAGASPRELLFRHAVDTVPTLRAARPDLPIAIDRVVQTALAKSPADRYQTGRALAAALDAAVRSESTPAPTTRRVRWWVAAVALIVTVTGASTLLWRSTAHAAFGSRDWIVVADVPGDTADAALHQAMRDALTLTLQQSRYANVLPPTTVAQTLRMMRRPDTLRLSDSVAREVALRQQARAVLIPSVIRFDSTYLVSARVIAAQNGADIFTVRERAARRADVLDALDRLALGVREQLGERLRDAAPPMKLGRATTSSLEALEAWTRGQQEFRAGRYQTAGVEFERAIALDSNFAMAHAALGISLYWDNQRADGDAHFERAMALRDRLTERERLLIQADIANWRQQTDAAVIYYEQVIAQFPDELRARSSLGYTLLRAGRCRESIEQYQWLRARDSSDYSVRVNLASCHSILQQYPEALAEYRAAFALRPEVVHTGSNVVHEYAVTLLRAGRPAAAESLAREELAGPPPAQARAHRTLALLALYQGHSAAARELLRQALDDELVNSSATSVIRDRMYLIRALYEAGKLDSARMLFRSATEYAVNQTLDPEWLGHLGVLGVLLGERRTAHELENRIVALGTHTARVDGITLHVLRGELALSAGDAATAREHFSLASALERRTATVHGAGRVAEAQGRRAEAERLYAEVVAFGPELDEDITSLFDARVALARLALARGDTSAAREHLGWVANQWKSGDSDLVIRRTALRELAILDRGRE